MKAVDKYRVKAAADRRAASKLTVIAVLSTRALWSWDSGDLVRVIWSNERA